MTQKTNHLLADQCGKGKQKPTIGKWQSPVLLSVTMDGSTQELLKIARVYLSLSVYMVASDLISAIN